LKAPHPQDSPVSAKPAAFDSIAPPPVVSDWQHEAEARRPPWALAQAQALLVWVLGPSSRGRFFRARVSLLLTILTVVLLWGGTDWYQRRVRTSWHRPLNVALVLVERDAIDPSTLALLTERVYELEKRLASEYKRHDGREFTPFSFVVTGPVKLDQAPPSMQDPSWLGVLGDTYRRWRWTRSIDARAGLDASEYDARIYLVMKPAEHGLAFVEGESEYGGRVGVAQVDIDPEMVDFSLFVAAHELMHTLGASDKYDATGRALYPGGFAEPNRRRLYPQPGAEVMARNVPLAPTSERPPNTLDELFVGDATATEVGWRKP
jgi:hypothetical protein